MPKDNETFQSTTADYCYADDRSLEQPNAIVSHRVMQPPKSILKHHGPDEDTCVNSDDEEEEAREVIPGSDRFLEPRKYTAVERWVECGVYVTASHFDANPIEMVSPSPNETLHVSPETRHDSLFGGSNQDPDELLFILKNAEIEISSTCSVPRSPDQEDYAVASRHDACGNVSAFPAQSLLGRKRKEREFDVCPHIGARKIARNSWQTPRLLPRNPAAAVVH